MFYPDLGPLTIGSSTDVLPVETTNRSPGNPRSWRVTPPGLSRRLAGRVRISLSLRLLHRYDQTGLWISGPSNSFPNEKTVNPLAAARHWRLRRNVNYFLADSLRYSWTSSGKAGDGQKKSFVSQGFLRLVLPGRRVVAPPSSLPLVPTEYNLKVPSLFV